MKDMEDERQTYRRQSKDSWDLENFGLYLRSKWRSMVITYLKYALEVKEVILSEAIFFFLHSATRFQILMTLFHPSSSPLTLFLSTFGCY